MSLRVLEVILTAWIPEAHAVLCIIPGFPCPGSGLTFSSYLMRIATGISGALAGIIVGMLIFYSLKLASSSSEESHITEVRNAYLHVLFGAVLVTGAAFIAATVPAYSGVANTTSIITSVLLPVRDFFFGMIAAALTINVGFNGVRLIFAQDDSASGNARQGITRGIIGLTAVMLSGIVVGAFGFNVFGVATTPNSGLLSDEIIGIGRFLITIFGALAVVCVVIAGFMLVISANEELKDRAKKVIIAVAVSVIVVMSSAIIISVFF